MSTETLERTLSPADIARQAGDEQFGIAVKAAVGREAIAPLVESSPQDALRELQISQDIERQAMLDAAEATRAAYEQARK